MICFFLKILHYILENNFSKPSRVLRVYIFNRQNNLRFMEYLFIVQDKGGNKLVNKLNYVVINCHDHSVNFDVNVFLEFLLYLKHT